MLFGCFGQWGCLSGCVGKDYSIGNKAAVAVNEKCLCSVHSLVVGRPPQSVPPSSSPRLPAEDAHTGGIDADVTPGCLFIEGGEGTYKNM